MKTIQTIFILLILTLLTTACGSILGESELERPQPLDVSAWPTPQSVDIAPTPTPFPRSSQPTAEPTAPTVVEVAPSGVVTGTIDTENTPDLVSEIVGNLDTSAGSEFAAQIRSLSGVPAIPPGLAPVAIAVLTTDQTAIRQGPGDNFGVVQNIERGELAGILGKNEDRSWVYVITIQKTLGWLPTDSLRITTGNLEAEPVLPPNPLASFFSQSASAPAAAPAASSSGSTSANAPAASSAVTTAQPLDPASLTTVTTGRATTSVNVRQRPGPDFQQIDVLAEDEQVDILALNQDNLWVLVETGEGDFGWTSASFLDIDGSLDNAPVLRTLDAPTASTELAPLVDQASVSVATQPAASPSTSSTTAAVNVSDSNETTQFPTKAFAPVASALIVEKADGRRGPGESFGPEVELTVDLPVDILARNEASTWMVVRTPLGGVSWTPLDNLKNIEGFVENAASVTPAWVESNETIIFNGPGIFYDQIGSLAINSMVAVLGLNDNRNWAFVEASNGGRGWVQLRLIDLAGSYDDVPEIAAPALAEGNPADDGLPVATANSATTGQLIFQTSSGGEINRINANGTGLQTLANGIDPVLSPDGQQVAFTRWTGDIGELWVMNVDGSNERQILGQMRKAKGPAWSPDGSQIALNFQQGGRLEEVRKCQPLDTSPSPPSNAGDFRGGISDDGEPVLCWTVPPDPNWSLRTINIADGSYEDLYGGLYAFRPAWDPGQPWRIVSDSGAGLLSVSVDDDAIQQEVSDVVGDSSPVFSPDGRYLVVTTRLQDEYAIFRMNSDGSGRVRLTETPLWVPVQADSDGRLWNNVAPTWSPDGSLIAFLTDRNDRWEIWLMNADGSDQRPMFSDEINDQLEIRYDFVDERVLSWR